MFLTIPEIPVGIVLDFSQIASQLLPWTFNLTLNPLEFFDESLASLGEDGAPGAKLRLDLVQQEIPLCHHLLISFFDSLVTGDFLEVSAELRDLRVRRVAQSVILLAPERADQTQIRLRRDREDARLGEGVLKAAQPVIRFAGLASEFGGDVHEFVSEVPLDPLVSGKDGVADGCLGVKPQLGKGLIIRVNFVGVCADEGQSVDLAVQQELAEELLFQKHRPDILRKAALNVE
ncbi:MAG: hypothetical protein R2762_30360 [Bryobacteraceae bacterium]